MPRCMYKYPGGQQCMWTGDKNICPDHRLIVQQAIDREKKRQQDKKKVAEEGLPAAIRRPERKRPKFSQPSRVTSAKEIIDKLPEAPEAARLVARVDELELKHGGIGDPSAPWCTCRGGCKCEKPKYNVWARGVGERKRNQST